MKRKTCPSCNQETPSIVDETTGERVCSVCGSKLKTMDETLPEGTVLGGFMIESELARGGMGIVYKAKQMNLKRTVALKVLSAELAQDETFIDSFFNEARAAAGLSHPNIVQVYDAGMASEGVYYFAMELINGKNLAERIGDSGPLPLRSGLAIAARVADAMAYAWEHKRMIHGDIKPENIILSTGELAKLADLGLANSPRDERKTGGELMLTPLYAAPELISGTITEANLKTDIYSFGITLYHMFSGKPPFVSNDVDEIYRMHLTETPVPLEKAIPGFPRKLSRIVSLMMEKVSADRPDSWKEIAETLHFMEDELHKKELIRRKRRKKMVYKVLPMTLTSVAVLLFAAAIAVYYQTARKGLPDLSTAEINRLAAEKNWIELSETFYQDAAPEVTVRKIRTYLARNRVEGKLLNEVHAVLTEMNRKLARQQEFSDNYKLGVSRLLKELRNKSKLPALVLAQKWNNINAMLHLKKQYPFLENSCKKELDSLRREKTELEKILKTREIPLRAAPDSKTELKSVQKQKIGKILRERISAGQFSALKKELGKIQMESLPPELRQHVRTLRTLLDAQSIRYVDFLKKDQIFLLREDTGPIQPQTTLESVKTDHLILSTHYGEAKIKYKVPFSKIKSTQLKQCFLLLFEDKKRMPEDLVRKLLAGDLLKRTPKRSRNIRYSLLSEPEKKELLALDSYLSDILREKK